MIEKPILELLDIDPETEFEMTTDGRRLIFEPVRPRRTKVLSSAKKVVTAYRETFHRLAQ